MQSEPEIMEEETEWMVHFKNMNSNCEKSVGVKCFGAILNAKNNVIFLSVKSSPREMCWQIVLLDK